MQFGFNNYIKLIKLYKNVKIFNVFIIIFYVNVQKSDI